MSQRAPFGPQLSRNGVTFRLWAPAAKRVELMLDSAHPMTALPGGWYEVKVSDAGVGTRYKLFDQRRDRPTGTSWDATVSIEAFSEAVHAVGAPREARGPHIAIADLFDHLPVALLRAQYAPARRDRATVRSKQSAPVA